VRIEPPDPVFEDLVARGLAERIGCEESTTLVYQRGGLRRCITARVKYQVKGPGVQTPRVQVRGSTEVRSVRSPAMTKRPPTVNRIGARPSRSHGPVRHR
jgi:hypothetical protein